MKTLLATAAAVVTLFAFAPTSEAGGRFSIGFSTGHGGCYRPAPPVYYHRPCPPPVHYHRPVYVAPPPVCYDRPVYRYRPVYHGYGY